MFSLLLLGLYIFLFGVRFDFVLLIGILDLEVFILISKFVFVFWFVLNFFFLKDCFGFFGVCGGEESIRGRRYVLNKLCYF